MPGPLAQGEGRRYVQHLVHGGASGLGDAPARVGGKRLQVAATALGVQNAQRERAFARPGNACDAHELSHGTSSERFFKLCTRRPAHLNGGRLGEGKRRGRFRCVPWRLDSRAICKAPRGRGGALSKSGANERIRTADLRITSALLYQLSHVGKSASCEAAI